MLARMHFCALINKGLLKAGLTQLLCLQLDAARQAAQASLEFAGVRSRCGARWCQSRPQVHGCCMYVGRA